MRRLLVIVAVLLAGCSAGSSRETHYQLGEFFISGPSLLSGDTDAITIENTGEFPHTLVVTRADGEVLTASDLVMPGQRVTLDLSLDPGAYQFTCRIVGQGTGGQLVDHYERGMHIAVSVSGEG
jgi:hypothetical protein